MGKQNRTGGRHKQDEMSSLSSENTQGTPEAKCTGNTRQMADMAENAVSNTCEITLRFQH